MERWRVIVRRREGEAGRQRQRLWIGWTQLGCRKDPLDTGSLPTRIVRSHTIVDRSWYWTPSNACQLGDAERNAMTMVGKEKRHRTPAVSINVHVVGILVYPENIARRIILEIERPIKHVLQCKTSEALRTTYLICRGGIVMRRSPAKSKRSKSCVFQPSLLTRPAEMLQRYGCRHGCSTQTHQYVHAHGGDSICTY